MLGRVLQIVRIRLKTKTLLSCLSFCPALVVFVFCCLMARLYLRGPAFPGRYKYDREPVVYVTDLSKELYIAAEEGDPAIVARLLNATSEELNCCHAGQSQLSALAVAAKNGHLEIVNLLLLHSSIDVKSGKSPLVVAACGGHVEVVQSLMAHPDIDVNLLDDWELSNFSMTALMFASRKGHTTVVHALLAHPNIDVNKHDTNRTYGKTALMHAAEHGQTETLQALLAFAGTQVNKRDRSTGRTALHFACESRILPDNSPVVSLLLSQPDIDVTLAASDGETALTGAANAASIDAIKALLAHNITNINARQRNGCTALWEACTRGHTEVVRLLLAHPDVDVNIPDKNGYTPVHLASQQICAERHLEVLRMLVARPDLDINFRTLEGYTPLMSAACQGHCALLQIVLTRKDVDLDLQRFAGGPGHRKCGMTALMFAANFNRIEHMEALLARGANADIANEDEDTDLDVAHYALLRDIIRPFATAKTRREDLMYAAERTAALVQVEESALQVPAVEMAHPVTYSPGDATSRGLEDAEASEELLLSPGMMIVADDDCVSTLTSDAPLNHAELNALIHHTRVTAGEHQHHRELLSAIQWKLTAHDRALELLVNKRKECPSLFWFYPKQRELYNWLRDPLKCLLQDSLMMVVVCPVTLEMVKCGPQGVGWEINTPKAWVREWGPAILFSIYVMQAAVLAGRVVGIPLPQLPDLSDKINPTGLNLDAIVNQKQLMKCLSSFAATTASVVGSMNGPMQKLCAKMEQQQQRDAELSAQGEDRGEPPSESDEILLDEDMPTQMFEDSYKSIHTFLTTGDNARLGKLEDQLRGSMERVLAEDGDVEWVSTEAVEIWKRKHAFMEGDEPQSRSLKRKLPADNTDDAMSAATFFASTSMDECADLNIPDVPRGPVLSDCVGSGTTQVATLHSVQARASSHVPSLGGAPGSTWLAVRLRAKGVREEVIADCEQKLVFDEDISDEQLFAELTREEFTKEYLGSVGITALGVQGKLLAIHTDVVAEYTQTSHPVNPLTPIAPFASVPTGQYATAESFAAAQQQLEVLTKQLEELKISTKSGGSPVPGAHTPGGGSGRGGQQQVRIQRTTATSINPRTSQPYTVDELVQIIHILQSDMGIMATNLGILQENQ